MLAMFRGSKLNQNYIVEYAKCITIHVCVLEGSHYYIGLQVLHC